MMDTFVAFHIQDGSPLKLILLNIDIKQADDVWVGTCLELGTSTFADSVEELHGEIADAVLLQLNEVEELGFMKDYLREHGVAIMQLPDHSIVSSEPSHRWALATAGA